MILFKRAQRPGENLELPAPSRWALEPWEFLVLRKEAAGLPGRPPQHSLKPQDKPACRLAATAKAPSALEGLEGQLGRAEHPELRMSEGLPLRGPPEATPPFCSSQLTAGRSEGQASWRAGQGLPTGTWVFMCVSRH